MSVTIDFAIFANSACGSCGIGAGATLVFGADAGFAMFSVTRSLGVLVAEFVLIDARRTAIAKFFGAAPISVVELILRKSRWCLRQKVEFFWRVLIPSMEIRPFGIVRRLHGTAVRIHANQSLSDAIPMIGNIRFSFIILTKFREAFGGCGFGALYVGLFGLSRRRMILCFFAGAKG